TPRRSTSRASGSRPPPSGVAAKSAVQCQHDGVQPMLATPGDLPVGPAWVYEVEWDGLRVLAEVVDGGLRLVTPDGQDVTPCFLELAGLTHLVPDGVVDGTVGVITPALTAAQRCAH